MSLSILSPRAGGAVIGLVNSASLGAAFIGAVIVTTALSIGPPVRLYVVLTLIGVACAPSAARPRRVGLGGRQ
jgi:hypothetical protein